MRNKKAIALVTGFSGLAAMALMSGCVVTPYGGGVAVVAPAPVVTVDMYPDYYCWDGYEYVGIVGGQYYYLGPGNVWVVCEPFRLARFHDWESGHPDWREHATPNERYRPANRGHDRDQGHGRGRDRDQGGEH